MKNFGSLSLEQKEICALLFDQISGLKDLELMFSRSDNGEDIAIGVAPLEIDSSKSVDCILVIKEIKNIVILAITDEMQEMVIDFLISIYNYISNKNNSIKIGDSVRFDNGAINTTYGVFGGMFLRVSTLSFLPEFKDSNLLSSGKIINFMILVFLSENEYLLLKNDGLNALLEYFYLSKKEIYAFKQK